ncbi:hypothetical protein CK203_079213 [Vitis vinifera]|uniref:Uncharacterized protein n=1 Tax=Vitis vinifera TaxID=29760 RepID=A0A438DZ02_VITVI|nr:hypothetical protein CK203_079213 [Vitis vinifera]
MGDGFETPISGWREILQLSFCGCLRKVCLAKSCCRSLAKKVARQQGPLQVIFIIFGLSEYPISEFELVAEELLMSDSVIKVFGAFRVAVKMLLMWNSKIKIDGGGNTVVTTSVLEVRNLIVLTENSVISSNTNLAVYGQGLLKLTGHGDAIKAQRLSLSLFYNITVGPGSLLQAPLDDDTSMVTKSRCESQTCPMDLITPPDDCHVNNTLSFSLQVRQLYL